MAGDEPGLSPDEQAVHDWAAAKKISADAVKFLVKDGFTSLEALGLLQLEDLNTKIPKGQQRLIMQAVKQLQPAPAEKPPGPDQPSAEHQGDPYVATVVGGLQAAQQQQAATGNTPEMATPVLTSSAPHPAAPTPAMSTAPTNLSWNDPQVFLRLASGKASPLNQYYDITEFANLSSLVVEDRVVAGGSTGPQLFFRDTHERRPKLSSLSIQQWSVANLAILSKLQEDGKLDATGTLDYLSYSIRMYQLLQRYQPLSVYNYDREYRKAQAQMGFRWGTEISHLQQVHLKENIDQPAVNSGSTTKTNKTKGPTTGDGQTICKLYNSKTGCTYTDCKFAHVCSRSGCEQKHSSATHDTAKN